MADLLRLYGMAPCSCFTKTETESNLSCRNMFVIVDKDLKKHSVCQTNIFYLINTLSVPLY